MNPEEARKNLDATLAKMGYQHPEETVNSRQPQYMSYSVTEDQKKQDKYGDYISQKPYDPYATFNTEEVLRETQRTNTCPVCENKALYSCSCSLQDMMCGKGHIWFVLKNGTIKTGDPHENED